MNAPQTALAIEHIEGSSPAAFKLTRLADGKSLPLVPIDSPYEFPVEGHPNSPLMRELRWYLERFLDYPFHPETDHADHVLDALRGWGTQAFNVLFDRRDAGDWLANSSIVQVRADDPRILSWPWEALYDPQAGAFVAHQRRMERCLNKLPDAQPAAGLPNDRVNILLVVSRPYEQDVRYRSIARPVIDLIQSSALPAHVDVLRPPSFDQLRNHLRKHPGYYHVLHFDGHGAYGDGFGQYSSHKLKAQQGSLIFEDKNGQTDPKSARDLSALLHENAVPVVVLNACQSAALDDQAEDAFATVATALLQSGMRSVVAMAYSLYVSGAQVFLPEFYRRLFESGSVAEAVRAGRQQMLSQKRRMSPRGPYEFEDWLLPVLYQQAPLDFDFASQARLETRESRLPQEIQEHREVYGFIGRDGPILQMERALQRNTPCILVQGLGGVGKTTLARGFLRWLDETGGLDGALWFDFRDIRTAEYVLNRTGEAFYGENFGAQLNKLDLLVRALGRLRVLIVWDNFESAAENLPSNDRDEMGRFLDAIRGTRGKVIMTSRSQEQWLGPTRRVEIKLGGLEGEERWEYCETILRELGLKVDRDDPELNRLMEQLAGHPLAMRVVLPRLEHISAANVSKAVHTNIAELGLNEQEDQGLFATLRFAEQGLAAELRPMMGLAGLHETYLDADNLEAMAKQVDPDWTRQRVDRLVAALANAGLVREIGDAIYEIHPLLTSYLRSQGEIPEACQRAFVEVMARLADSMTPRPYHEQQGPFWVHGANFHFALHLSGHLSMNQHFGALTQSLAAFALNSRNFIEASRLFIQLAEHAAARADLKWEASAYHQLGVVDQQQRYFSSAQRWYVKALAISEKQGDLQMAALTYGQLGGLAQEQRDFEAAREWYLKSLAVSEKQPILDVSAKAYHQLGIIAAGQREFAAAREWYLKSLSIKEKQGNWVGAAKTYHQLGTIAQEQRDLAAAREWYLKSLVVEEQQGDPQGVATSYQVLGSVAIEQEEFATAREWYLKSLAILENQGDLHGAAYTYDHLGILAGKEENSEDSGKWLIRAIAGFQKTHDQQGVQRNLRNFLVTYQQAPPEVREKLKAIWSEIGLGPLPVDDTNKHTMGGRKAASSPAPVSALPDAAPPPPAPAPPAADADPAPGIEVPTRLVVDNVHFTLTGQNVLGPGQAYELLFWVHVEQQKAAVLESASAALGLPLSDISVKSEGPYPLQRGSRLSIRLKIDGLKCPDSHKWIMWMGEIGNTAFVVEVPAGASEGTYAGSASVRLNGCEIAKMSFVVRVGPPKLDLGEIPSQTTAHRKAFASYASEDRVEVLNRIQGMKAAYKGLDVFVDVVELRSGQNWEQELRRRVSDADVFYLFWCRHASKSDWVSKEWHWALQAKGEDFIDPVPLEAPEFAQPPQELAAKHFNDPFLAFIAAAGGGHSPRAS